MEIVKILLTKLKEYFNDDGEFKEFISKGNVVDLAVGVIIGGAFGKIVTSLVNDVLTPIIGVFLGGLNFSELSFGFKDAQINYGLFIQTVVDFLIIALTIFIIVRVMGNLQRKKEEAPKPAPKPSNEEVLLTEIRDLLKKDVDSIMWDLVENNIARVSGRTAFDAMRKGDATAKSVVDNYIRYIAVGLVNVINALQPDVICIGGGISHEKDNLLVPLRKHVNRGRYSIYSDKQTELCCAVLGNDAGIIGAALLTE